jgi:mono/diheme cytochrome c family protein
MRRLLVGLGIVLWAGCSIDTGFEPPPPPPWGTPVSGGTMTVSRDGLRAIVADPDRDRVYVADLVTERLADVIDLALGSEPGRVIEDDAGRFHVALRGSGELLTITGGDRQLRFVCGEPRGLAYEAATDLVHVACATGELVSIAPGGDAPTRVVRIERDLRDVIVRERGLAVTTFRSANVLVLDDSGAIAARITPPVAQRIAFGGGSIPLDTSTPGGGSGEVVDAPAAVAWRTIALPDGRLLMAHQRRLDTTLRVVTGGYGGGCSGGAVESALTYVGADDQPVAVAPIAFATLPVDVAVSPTNGDVAVVAAGHDAVMLMSKGAASTPDKGECSTAVATPMRGLQIGAPTAVAWTPSGALLTFYPEAGGITIQSGGTARGITLADRPRQDLGRSLFHRATGVGLACASCHPEGRDDGAVWTFDTLGVRRTQNLGGGLLSRAPYHWGADMPTLHALVQDVFTQRMAGTFVEAEEERALGAWLDRIPAPRGVVADGAAVARGEELFLASEQGCASCHGGAQLTNNKLANVGLGLVKVPSLVGVGGRAPLMHDGCAATLADRFGPCGGGDQHGRTSHLTAAELADLTAYLESL